MFQRFKVPDYPSKRMRGADIEDCFKIYEKRAVDNKLENLQKS